MTKLNDVILDAMESKNERTLQELYLIIEDHPEFVWETSVRKHRVRSALYNLQKHNKIERCAPQTYKLI